MRPRQQDRDNYYPFGLTFNSYRRENSTENLYQYFKRLKKFYFIVNSLLYSPEYVVKSSKSNEFKVRLATSRFFFNEKWLIRNGKIVPIGWDNKYTAYYLNKKD